MKKKVTSVVLAGVAIVLGVLAAARPKKAPPPRRLRLHGLFH